MAELRRRLTHLIDDSSNEPSREASPDGSKPELVRLVTAEKFDSLQKKAKKGRKRGNGLIFVLGGIFGIVVALLFASHNEVIKFEGLMDMNLDTLLDVIPAGIVKDARELQKHERDAVNYDSFAVGLHLQSQGISAKHPVIMIPGVISTGLESWGTEPSSRQYFRKRLWGSWSMMRALVLDQASWKRHIMLDKQTGLDPPNVKLRAAQGFDAADFFITGYWIWSKILENLASIGYDPTNAFTAAYDWRLSYMNLEKRDQYFSRLKSYIETAVRTQDHKVVLASHSMGSQVLLYFLKWVEHPDYGGGGPDWVNSHVDSWINISGCMLGALKSLPAVLSGEMKDTAQLNAFAVYGLEKFLSRDERAEIFRAMPGISSMLPKGGNAVWGNSTWAPDDPDLPMSPLQANGTEPSEEPDQRQPRRPKTYGNFINFKNNNSSMAKKNLTVEESITHLLDNSEDWYQNQIHSSYSHGVAHTRMQVEMNEDDPRTWLNPLEARLPLAPDLKIYCFYGIGKPTERSYFYQDDTLPASVTGNHQVNTSIDTGFTDAAVGVDHGVIMGEGDGTVNLISAGYMCAKGWRDIKRYNPAGVKVTVYEMPHEPDRFSPRGGPNTGKYDGDLCDANY